MESRRHHRLLIAVLASLLSLNACVGVSAGGTDGLSEVFRSEQCGLAEPVSSLLLDPGQWQLVTGAGRPFEAGANSDAVPFPQEAADGHIFLVMIALGSKPTPGYGIEQLQARRQGREWMVEYLAVTPPQDTMRATVMTSPCVVFSLPASSAIKQVRMVSAGSEEILLLPLGG